VLLATGSSDFKARIFSAFIKGVDKKPAEPTFGSGLAFGELLGEFDSNGWVHCVAFSPSGNRLGFCGHDSSFSVADVTPGGTPSVKTVRFPELPLTRILFVTENSVVGVGHDCNPTLFSANASGGWSFIAKLDQKAQAKSTGPAKSAMNVFKDKVNLGASSSDNDTVLETKHQNSITWIYPLKKAGNNVSSFTTSGLDGKLITWDLNQLQTQIGLKVA